MARVSKVRVETYVLYDGTNGQEILDAINGPNGGGATIGSDDGTTLVVIENDENGVPTGNDVASFQHGDGWNALGWGFISRDDIGSPERWLTVSEKVVLTRD